MIMKNQCAEKASLAFVKGANKEMSSFKKK